MKDKIYEVDIVREDGVIRGAAIISNKGITLKDDDGNIVICFNTVDIKRDGIDFKTMNDECTAMTEDELKKYWDLNISIVSTMIKRGIFSVNWFNYSVDRFINNIPGLKNKDSGIYSAIPENACSHYEG